MKVLLHLQNEKGGQEAKKRKILKAVHEVVKTDFGICKFLSEVDKGKNAIAAAVAEIDPEFQPQEIEDYLSEAELRQVYRTERYAVTQQWREILFSIYPSLKQNKFPKYKSKDAGQAEEWKDYIKEIENLDQDREEEVFHYLVSTIDEKKKAEDPPSTTTDSDRALIKILVRAFLDGKHLSQEGNLEVLYRTFLYEKK